MNSILKPWVEQNEKHTVWSEREQVQIQTLPLAKHSSKMVILLAISLGIK